MITTDKFTKINNDVNGNPRYVAHFLEMLSKDEQNSVSNEIGRISKCYELATKKMKQFGGKKYSAKSFGGGIVFQSYNLQSLCDEINKTL